MSGVQDELRSLMGLVPWGSLDVKELCITPEVSIPQKLKIPNFDKYDEIENPIYHLWSYWMNMSIWFIDEHFLVKLFPKREKPFPGWCCWSHQNLKSGRTWLKHSCGNTSSTFILPRLERSWEQWAKGIMRPSRSIPSIRGSLLLRSNPLWWSLNLSYISFDPFQIHFTKACWAHLLSISLTFLKWED